MFARSGLLPGLAAGWCTLDIWPEHMSEQRSKQKTENMSEDMLLLDAGINVKTNVGIRARTNVGTLARHNAKSEQMSEHVTEHISKQKSRNMPHHTSEHMPDLVGRNMYMPYMPEDMSDLTAGVRAHARWDVRYIPEQNMSQPYQN